MLASLGLLWAAPALAYEPPARIAVAQWPATRTDHSHKGLQKKVKKQIGREDVAFVTAIDLYQSGRMLVDVAPASQHAKPSEEAIDEILGLIEETGAIPFSELTETEWGARAEMLRRAADGIPFVDEIALREPLFQLYTQIGRAAENSNQGAPPFYATVDGKPVNYYWFAAAALAHQDKTLLSKLLDKELHQNIVNYKDQIDKGKYSKTTLSFVSDTFDSAALRSEYLVRVDGLDVTIGADGLFEIPLGIHDVALLHRDKTYGMSVRVERQSADGGYEYVWQTGDKRINRDLVDKLVESPDLCAPRLADDFASYLTLYGQLHEDTAVYVVVPKFGKTSKKNLLVWRWADGKLARVDESCG